MKTEVKLDTIYVPSGNVVARRIEDDIIIVPLVAGIGDADDELYTLNETGRAIWQELDGQKTLGHVVNALKEEYASDGDNEISTDVLGFAEEMVRRGILAIK